MIGTALILLALLSGARAQVTKEVLAAAIPVFQNQLFDEDVIESGTFLYGSLLADISNTVVGTHGRTNQLPEDFSASYNGLPEESSGPTNQRFEWVYGVWHCSTAQCGQTGHLVREAKCMDSITQSTVEESLCSSPGSTPIKVLSMTTVACKAPACEDDFRWVASPWGYCSRDCGGGVMNRTIDCLSAQNTVEPAARCSAILGQEVPPASSQPCNVHRCKGSNSENTHPRVTQKPDLRMMSRSSSDSDSSSEKSSSSDDNSSSSKRSSSDDSSSKSSSKSDDSSSDSSSGGDDNSSEDDDSSSGGGSSRASGKLCSRCKSGGIGPWFLEKRLWYQVAWDGSRICFKGCYKHEDARSGKTKCESTSGAPKVAPSSHHTGLHAFHEFAHSTNPTPFPFRPPTRPALSRPYRPSIKLIDHGSRELPAPGTVTSEFILTLLAPWSAVRFPGWLQAEQHQEMREVVRLP